MIYAEETKNTAEKKSVTLPPQKHYTGISLLHDGQG